MTHLLLVEDDIFLAKVFKSKLEKLGYTVTHLSDGSTVVEEATKTKPNIILLDIIMPHKDGFQVLEELKQNTKTTSIPVLILSTLQMPEDIAKGKQLGANDYLPKASVDFDKVISSIKALSS